MGTHASRPQRVQQAADRQRLGAMDRATATSLYVNCVVNKRGTSKDIDYGTTRAGPRLPQGIVYGDPQGSGYNSRRRTSLRRHRQGKVPCGLGRLSWTTRARLRTEKITCVTMGATMSVRADDLVNSPR